MIFFSSHRVQTLRMLVLLLVYSFEAMIRELTAVQFTRFMTSGRTSPALCACEDESGSAAGDFVVKLRGSVHETGLLNELVGVKLADHFGLSFPEPALILMEPALVELVATLNPSKAELIRGSVGLNFGTQALLGFSTWPVDKSVPGAMRQTAVDIFAFDALLQNPDRRYNNPNLLTSGDSIMVFDHEIAFSFLLDILGSPTPWDLERQRYLSEHVFFRQLKAQSIDLEAFTGRLAALSGTILERIFADVPLEWNNGNAKRIAQHLSAVRDHAEEFAEQIRRFLA